MMGKSQAELRTRWEQARAETGRLEEEIRELKAKEEEGLDMESFRKEQDVLGYKRWLGQDPGQPDLPVLWPDRGQPPHLHPLRPLLLQEVRQGLPQEDLLQVRPQVRDRGRLPQPVAGRDHRALREVQAGRQEGLLIYMVVITGAAAGQAPPPPCTAGRCRRGRAGPPRNGRRTCRPAGRKSRPGQS